MTSICLGMNLLNEEKNVTRVVTSALQICDRVVVIDTGCTDDTLPMLRHALPTDVPLTVYKEEWVGHAHNRSILLDKVRESGANYCLMLDADMELVIDGAFPELGYDEYLINIKDRSLMYPLPLLTSCRRHFFYHGVAHAYLACDDGPSEGILLPNVTLIDHGGGGNRTGKIERDRDLLGQEIGKNPADRRSWFYLAQSFRDLDQINEAIAAYKIRAMLGGWDEEVYQALYTGGHLMCAHINFYEGAKMLLAAAELKPNRAEALRVLAGCANAVANKIPYPTDEKLFVEPGAYVSPPEITQKVDEPPEPPEMPPLPNIGPRDPRKLLRQAINVNDVTAIIVTRGDVDLTPILETLPYPDIVVWDNSLREHDYKVFGRYAAIPEALNPVIYWQDDDVIFTKHAQLLAEYNPEGVVVNMDAAWIQGAGYGDFLAMMGGGSLCPSWLPQVVFDGYLQHYPWDDDLLVEADFAFGTLAPFKRVDLGFEVREFSDDPDRLYQQPGQTARKWNMIQRGRDLKAKMAA